MTSSNDPTHDRRQRVVGLLLVVAGAFISAAALGDLSTTKEDLHFWNYLVAALGFLVAYIASPGRHRERLPGQIGP